MNLVFSLRKLDFTGVCFIYQIDLEFMPIDIHDYPRAFARFGYLHLYRLCP